ncbi:MotA/TolQ/ExbB proton channel family protein [Ornithinibacillus xuwenensis]|uniref:MotA/TolQ/ExbB proton channel family protein n=1 Tax=Ornithinibacillus xuwenensis TaxID=3144668 RepID=A0ABU9XKY4_9BACI
MVQFMLEIFTSEEKAEAILASPLIELIFMILIAGFLFAFTFHILLYSKLKKLRNYLRDTNRMDMEPLHTLQNQYKKRQQEDTVEVETFVQERFSNWRVLGFPVISLIKMIQMTVSVFILIGVLGTFIGLTMSLGSINATGDQIVENVAAVLSGIDVAFYTSIAGMGFSLVMTIALKMMNTEYMLTDIMLKVESQLERSDESSMVKLINVSEMINQSIQSLQETNQQSLGSIERAFEGFQEYTTGLQQSARDLAHFNDGLSQNLKEFQTLFDQMKEVTDGFGKGTTRLNENFEALFSYFQKMDARNDRMAKVFENTYEKVKEVSTSQMNTLNHFEESVVDLKNFSSSIVEGQNSVKDSISKIIHQSYDIVKKMEAHNKEFKQVFGTDLSTKLSGITNYLGELSRDFDRLGESIVTLPQALEVINQTQVEHKHLLSDRFEELKHFNKTFSNHIKEHTTESMMFEKQVREASKTYDQVGMKNNQLIQEINTTITQMNQAFSHRENQLESSVGFLKDTLSKYVSSLEGTLGNRMDQVVRNISDSMEKTNDTITREFMEIRRISEQIHQSNARYTQQMLQELGREIQALNRQLSTVSQQGAPRQTGIGMNQNGY